MIQQPHQALLASGSGPSGHHGDKKPQLVVEVQMGAVVDLEEAAKEAEVEVVVGMQAEVGVHAEAEVGVQAEVEVVVVDNNNNNMVVDDNNNYNYDNLDDNPIAYPNWEPTGTPSELD